MRFKIKKQRLRGVLENTCSAICSKNSGKIPMKKLIFSKVVELWRTALLQMNFFIGIFQGFFLQILPGNFQYSYFQRCTDANLKIFQYVLINAKTIP